MGLLAEVIAGKVTNAAALTALTMVGGDSLTIRPSASGGKAYLDDLWAKSATAGIARVRSAAMHDDVQGIRLRTIAGVTRGLLPDAVRTPLVPTDTIIAEQQGGGAETDNLFLLAYYEDAQGLAARLDTWQAIKPRIVNIATVEVATATNVTAGLWSTGTKINTTFDLLKPNTDYAVLGYQTDVAVGAVAIRGADTGNVRIGGPGTTETIETRDWFQSLAEAMDVPYIPVFNSQAKSGTFVHVCDPALGANVNVDLIVAQLAG